MGQERSKIALQALANALRSLLDVFALKIICFERRLQHLRHRLLGIRQELLLADSQAQQRHTLECLAAQPAFLLSFRIHNELLQEWHDAIVVLCKVLLDDTSDDCDARDGLLLHHAMLRGLQPANELVHEAACILDHQSVLQLLAEGDKRGHGHGGHTVNWIVHLLEQHRHDSPMPRVLEMRGLVIGHLSESMKRSVSHPGVGMIRVREQQLGHLVHMLCLLRILHSLLHGCERCELRLPSVL
mmetsp:Transcript_21109/g.52850  ORF Transcript_21109/g.52850 Transcript_21109/m.52850 type:complete len:243 (+) Transcript_21109:553-1281(+)